LGLKGDEMTKLKKDKPPWEVSAMVYDAGSNRPIVVQITPCELIVRQKGRRRGYSLPWAACYDAAVRGFVRERDKAARDLRKSLGRKPTQAEVAKFMEAGK